MRIEHPHLEEERVAERYLKGRLSADEAARFEEHYLTCQACLEELELVERFERAFKDVAREEVARSVVSIWARLRQSHQAVLAVAAALLLVVLPGGYSLLTIHRLGDELERSRTTVADLQQQRAEPEINVPILRLSPVRSAAEQSEPVNRITLPADLQRLVLSLELEGPEFPRYRLALVNPAGQVTWQRADAERDHRGALVLILPSSLFETGDSLLRVEGLIEQEEPVPLAPFAFRVSR